MKRRDTSIKVMGKYLECWKCNVLAVYSYVLPGYTQSALAVVITYAMLWVMYKNYSTRGQVGSSVVPIPPWDAAECCKTPPECCIFCTKWCFKFIDFIVLENKDTEVCDKVENLIESTVESMDSEQHLPYKAVICIC